MPVPRVRGDERDIAGREVVLLAVAREDPLAFRHHEDLIGRVNVPAVARAVLERDLGDAQVLADLAADRGLRLHVAGEDLRVAPGPAARRETDDAHASPRTVPRAREARRGASGSATTAGRRRRAPARGARRSCRAADRPPRPPRRSSLCAALRRSADGAPWA